jgi:hypothetical protein
MRPMRIVHFRSRATICISAMIVAGKRSDGHRTDSCFREDCESNARAFAKGVLRAPRAIGKNVPILARAFGKNVGPPLVLSGMTSHYCRSNIRFGGLGVSGRSSLSLGAADRVRAPIDLAASGLSHRQKTAE